MKGNDILFVTTHFAPDFQYGGVVESGTKLLKYLRKINVNIKLICVSKNPKNAQEFIQEGDIICKSQIFHDWGLSVSLVWKLFKAIKQADKIYINGIVTFPTTLAQFYAYVLNKPVINAVRGGLETWRVNHKSWKKKPYMALITLPLLRKASLIHVTAKSEQNTIENLGFKQSFISSNGVDTEYFEELPSSKSRLISDSRKFIFLFLSRTDKEKGIDILIKSYQLFSSKYSIANHQLMIVGPDNQSYLQNMKIDYESKNIVYIDGIYNKEKIELLCNADVLVLPSYSENFGNIIAEALTCKLPVITTTGTPWSEIEYENCGFYIEPTVKDLLEAMEKIYHLNKSKRSEMGANGRFYIMKNFSWYHKAEEISKKLDTL